MIPEGAVYRIDVEFTPDDPFGFDYYAIVNRLSDDLRITAFPGNTPDEAVTKARAYVVSLERPTPAYEPRTVYVDADGETVAEHSVKA
jgi:hypothetical protein